MSPAYSLGLILISTLTTAAYFTLVTKLMRSLPEMSSNFLLCITNFAAALVITPLWLMLYYSQGISLPTGEAWYFFLLASGFLLLSRELYFYAYGRTDIANITVFSALTPIYTLGTGFVLLNEKPSLPTVIGVFMITLAIYSIFLPAGSRVKNRPTYFFYPFKHIFSSLPILCGFLSTIPTAFGAIYQKKTLYSMDIISFSLCLFLFIGSAALGVELLKKGRPAIRSNIVAFKQASFWWVALLLAIMHISFAPILMSYDSAAALTLQRCSILFQIVFAYCFLHQKEDFRKRVFASLVIILGFFLIWNQFSLG